LLAIWFVGANHHVYKIRKGKQPFMLINKNNMEFGEICLSYFEELPHQHAVNEKSAFVLKTEQ